MRRTLIAACALALGAGASAQCIPNQTYADSVYGVWPDTLENFSGGMVNVFYSDTLNLLVPQDAGLINEAFSGFIIDSVAFDGISGLPPGISVICNSQTAAACSFLTNQVGCGLLEGIPTSEGIYDMEVNVTAYTTFIGNVLPVPQTFTGYHIEILPENVGLAVNGSVTSGKVRNTPNPFSDRTTIEFALAKAGQARVRVFSLVGEEVWSTTLMGKQGVNTVPFEVGRLESGAYLYKVESGARSWTGRMVINR